MECLIIIPISAVERAFLDEQVATGAAATIEEYIAALIAADMRRKGSERRDGSFAEEQRTA